MNPFETLSIPAAAPFAGRSAPAEMQAWLAEIHLSHGLEAALEKLFDWSLVSGYIPLEKLCRNRYYSYRDPVSGVTFRSQINLARHGYLPVAATGTLEQCLLCIGNAGKPGRETLRSYLFPGMPSGEYFAQHSPFPLYPRHFVLISLEHTPMRMDSGSVADMLWLADQLPEYVICSNSDVSGAGASILQHHHYQLIHRLRLPVMDAQWRNNHCTPVAIAGVTASAGLLNYPFSCCRISSRSPGLLLQLAGRLIEAWKARDAAKNSCNLLLQRDDSGYVCHIFFRCSDARTGPAWQLFKQEGIGIIEVAGETIYPLPGGPQQNALQEQIARQGLQILLGILRDNDPVKPGDLAVFENWLQEQLPQDHS